MWNFLRGGATVIPWATFIPESRVLRTKPNWLTGSNMLLYKPNAVLGIRSWSHFFYQCIRGNTVSFFPKNLPTWGMSTSIDFSAEDPTTAASVQSPSGHHFDFRVWRAPDSEAFKTFWDKLSRLLLPKNTVEDFVSNNIPLMIYLYLIFDKSSSTNWIFSLQKSILNLIFAGYPGSKTPVWNILKIQFVELDFSKLIFQKSSTDQQGVNRA